MSSFESMTWLILGYTAMPVIILTGFICVAIISVGILSFFDKSSLSD